MKLACTVLRLAGSRSALRPRLLRALTLFGVAVGMLTSIPSLADAGWNNVGPFVAYWAWDGRVADDGTATLASDRGILQVYRIAPDGNSLQTVIDFDRSPWLPDGYLWKIAQLEPGRYGLLFPGIFDGNDLVTAVWVLQEGVSPTAPTLLPFSADWLFADPDGNVLVLGRDPAFLTYTLRSKDDPSIELDAGTIDTPDVQDVAIDGSGHLHIAYSAGGERYRKTTEDGTQLLDVPVPGTGIMKIRTDEPGNVGILSGTSAFFYLAAGGSALQGPTQLRESARPLGSGHVDFGLSQCGDVFACWDYGYYQDPGGEP
ncbi:MAG: hypothetical protein R3E12_16040 [Candidatus Eisenbacteria bacterium]